MKLVYPRVFQPLEDGKGLHRRVSRPSRLCHRGQLLAEAIEMGGGRRFRLGLGGTGRGERHSRRQRTQRPSLPPRGIL